MWSGACTYTRNTDKAFVYFLYRINNAPTPALHQSQEPGRLANRPGGPRSRYWVKAHELEAPPGTNNGGVGTGLFHR